MDLEADKLLVVDDVRKAVFYDDFAEECNLIRIEIVDVEVVSLSSCRGEN